MSVSAVKMAVAIGDRLGHQFGLPRRDDWLDRLRDRRGNEARARSQSGARGEQDGTGLAAAAGDYERMSIHSLVRIRRPLANQVAHVGALEESAPWRYLFNRARGETYIDDPQLAGLPGARI